MVSSIANSVATAYQRPLGPSKPRQVSTEEGAEFAQQEQLLFVEASARSGLNVELAFVEASRDILRKVKNGVFDDTRVSPLLLLEYSNTDLIS